MDWKEPAWVWRAVICSYSPDLNRFLQSGLILNTSKAGVHRSHPFPPTLGWQIQRWTPPWSWCLGNTALCPLSQCHPKTGHLLLTPSQRPSLSSSSLWPSDILSSFLLKYPLKPHFCQNTSFDFIEQDAIWDLMDATKIILNRYWIEFSIGIE